MMEISHASAVRTEKKPPCSQTKQRRSSFEDITCVAGWKAGQGTHCCQTPRSLSTLLHQAAYMFSQHSLRRSAPCSTPAGSSNTSTLSGEGEVTTGNQTDLLKKPLPSHQNSPRADRHPQRCFQCSCQPDAVMPRPAKGEGRAPARRPR